MPERRRFPLPWSVEQQDVCFIVTDSAGQKLAYVYFEDEPGATLGGQPAHPRRGPAHRSQRGEAAGASAQS